MSALSAIGLIPPVFPSGGHSIVFPIPNTDIKANGSGTSIPILSDFPIPNGTYLVVYNFAVASGDSTTTIQLMVADTNDASLPIIQSVSTTLIYQELIDQDDYFYTNGTSIEVVTSGAINVDFSCFFSGNTTTLGIIGGADTNTITFIPIL